MKLLGRHTRALVIIATLFALVASGCAAIFNSNMDPVLVTSNPSGGLVVVNGAPSGRTPVELMLSNKFDYTIAVELDGYEANSVLLTQSVGAGWIVLDVLFTGLIGIVVDAATGSWNELSASSLHFELRDAAATPADEPAVAGR